MILLVFCWAHVRRDFIAVAKGYPELKEWAIEWLKQIREAYRCNRDRVQHEDPAPEFAAADAKLRAVMDAMQTNRGGAMGRSEVAFAVP